MGLIAKERIATHIWMYITRVDFWYMILELMYAPLVGDLRDLLKFTNFCSPYDKGDSDDYNYLPHR